MRKIPYNQGNTFLELLVVLTLVVTLLALSLPAFQQLISKSYLTTQMEDLVAALNYARSEAISQGKVVTICKSKDGKKCGGQWKDGWIVFIDRQISGQVDLGDDILRSYRGKLIDNLEWVGQRSNDYLQMDASGGTHGQAGTFFYKYQEKRAKVIVSPTGRIRIESPTNERC